MIALHRAVLRLFFSLGFGVLYVLSHPPGVPPQASRQPPWHHWVVPHHVEVAQTPAAPTTPTPV